MLSFELMRLAVRRLFTKKIMKALLSLLGSVILLILFNEFILYKMIVLKCTWPYLRQRHVDRYQTLSDDPNRPNDAVKVLIVSDPHVDNQDPSWINSFHEWNMENTFKALLFIHRPDVVFIIGDLIESGFKQDLDHYEKSINRFKKIFSLTSSPSKEPVIKVVVGNHDIGYHNQFNQQVTNLYKKHFYGSINANNNRIFNFKGVNFVLLNSMSFEDDNCEICRNSLKELEEIGKKFKCLRGDVLDSELDCQTDTQLTIETKVHRNYDTDSELLKEGHYSRPVLFQHFPLYRSGDASCDPQPLDAMPKELKKKDFVENFDCLSSKASNKILQELQPRLIFSGHTHYSCKQNFTIPPDNLEIAIEHSVASFSTRKIPNSAFLLMRVTPGDYEINKCYTPSKFLLIYTYLIGFLFIIIHHLSACDHLYKFLVKRLNGRFSLSKKVEFQRINS